jgi:hypothetical protein
VEDERSSGPTNPDVGEERPDEWALFPPQLVDPPMPVPSDPTGGEIDAALRRLLDDELIAA